MFSNLKQTFNTPNTSFGFSSNVTPNPFGQTAFGKTPSTGFGTPAPAFGQQSTPLFGQATQHGSLFASAAPTNTFGQTVNAQPTFGSGMFGNASSQPSGSGLFGAANTSTFGQQNKSTGFGFGTNTANTGFGFGQSTTQVQPQQQTTGLFGQSTSNLFGQSSGFGTNTANNQVGTVIKFTPVTGTDTMVKGSINQTISTRHHCITCMKEYENKSLEELRWEDYQVNRKGPQQGAQSTGGLFGNMSQPVGAPLFGSSAAATSANTLFGQQDKSVFGQSAPGTGFGTSAPAFGATPTSNTGGGLFGKPLTGFGTATTSSAFPFSSTAQTNNLFGANNAAKPAFGVSSQPNSLFGQPTGFGTQSTFGSFGTTTNQNVGLFNQNKTTPFSIMPTATTNTFGSFATPAAQNTNSLFSGAKPNTGGFGGFGQTSATPAFGQPTFGQNQQGGGLFNSSFNKTSTPLFGQTQTTNTLGTGLQMGGSNTLFGTNVNKPNTMFGNNLGLFSSGFGTTTNTGNFNLGSTMSHPGVPNPDQNSINTEQQIISMTSTPYGTPSLLNNINEVSSDLKDCTRPTNPSELNALLNTVVKPQTSAPAEKLKPVQVFGRKVPMFDGLEYRDESLISNIRINNNPKRLIVRNHPNKNKDLLNDSLLRSSACTLTLDDLSNLNNRSSSEDKSKEKETTGLYPDLKALQKEMSPGTQKNSSNDINTANNVPISSTMITSPSKALFLTETTKVDEHDSKEDEEDLFTEASESQDWQLDNDSIRGVTKNNSLLSESISNSDNANTSHPTGIILTRPEYYTVPSLEELVKFISEDGSCVVKGFTVGRYGYGSVYFSDAFDVSNLNLDELVHFRHKEINIYPDETKKPPIGQGLNRKAQVTLDKVWPLDKKAKELVTDVDSLAKYDYAGRLRRLCEKQNTRFVEYRPDTGSWVFKVEHFSRYGLSDSDDGEDFPYNYHSIGLILSKPEYYIEPSLQELAKFIKGDGSCVVKGFKVGRYGYGSVYFPDSFDVSNLNLDIIVHIKHKEIIVYPDETMKPPQGQGLNRRAQVTLDKVWPLDKNTKEIVTDVNNLSKYNYAEHLQRLCQKQNTKFVEYRPETGSWVFEVEHFSKYGLPDSDDEIEYPNVPNGELGKPNQLSAKTGDKTANTISLPTSVTDSVSTASAPFGTVYIPSEDAVGMHPLTDFRSVEGTMYNGLLDYESTCLNPRPNNIENGACSLMKSTFFEQEFVDFDDTSDVCSSDGGILELSNYVSRNSPKRRESDDFDDQHIPESEYLPLDICEDDEIPEPLDKPEVVPLLDIDIPCSFDTSYNNIADLTLFKGKCFKVGWTRSNTFLCLEKDEVPSLAATGSYHTIAFKQLQNVNENTFPNLEKHLECQYEHSGNTSENYIPHSFSFYGNEKLDGHQDISNKSSKNSYEKQIWDLLATLFRYPEEDSNFIERNDIYRTKVDKDRKQKLSGWIQSVVDAVVNSEVNNPNRDNTLKILSYISGNKIDEAANLAMKSKNINLALLISQMPTSALAQINLRKQLATWEKCDVYDYIDKTILKIYAIISGNTMIKSKKKTLLVYEGMEWIRIFALYFWYVTKAQHPLSEAVHMYERMFEESKLAVPPIPDYEGVPENVYDLRFQLLKYYSNNAYPITQVLNTFTYTSDPMDYRLSWFVFQTLHSLNQELTSKRARNHMHINFAMQLEQMGLWHWAVYILTFIENIFVRRDAIVDMIGRHILIRNEETPEYKYRERMVIHKFGISPKLFEVAKAEKAQQTNNIKDAVYYFCYAEEWKRANDLIMSNYAPENLLSYDYEHLIELLTPLSDHKELLPDWEEAGGLILDFSKLGVQYNNILALNDPIAIKRQLISFRSSVINVSVRFKFFKPLTYLHDVCVAEMSGRIAVMLRKLLTVINGHTYELCVDTAINAQTLPMTTDFLKQELNSILIDFLNGNQPKMIYL